MKNVFFYFLYLCTRFRSEEMLGSSTSWMVSSSKLDGNRIFHNLFNDIFFYIKSYMGKTNKNL